ncbi:hypothetical protein PAEAM_28730 [Paenibacillus sp. GM1FR]|nr:hypothetical protein PAEAM_28730 [Paenibacillus sp. GM1FR]
MLAKQRTIILIDMQSFYASVEKAKMPQYKNRPLAVAGDPARRSGIILAACPLAKAKLKVYLPRNHFGSLFRSALN